MLRDVLPIDLLQPPVHVDFTGLDELPDHIPDWVMLEPPLRESVIEPDCVCGCQHTAPVADSRRDDAEYLSASERLGESGPSVTWGSAGTPLLPGPSTAVLALQAAVDAVCDVDPTALPAPQALVDSQALLRIGQQLRVHDMRRFADVKDRQLHGLVGYRSTYAWLHDYQPDADGSDATLAGKLHRYPALLGSVESGSTSLTAAKKVAHALGRCRGHVDRLDGLIDGQPAEEVVVAVVRNVVDLVVRSRFGMDGSSPEFRELVMRTEQILADGGTELCRLEGAFTLLAEEVPVGSLMGLLDDLVLAVLPSVLEDRAQRGRDKAGLSVSRKDDGSGWYVEGDLDLECGERLFTALTSEVRRDPDNASDTEAAAELREQGIEWWEGDGDAARRPRSKRQRLHDALNRLLGRYLEQGLGGTHHKQPVQINVTIEAPAIDGEPGAMPGKGDSGAPIPRSMIRRWWCDSGITAFILRRGGKALRAVHAGRTLTAVERRAVLIEHGNRCVGIGCCSPTDPTVVLRPHHVRRYADDGVTSVEDTVLACDVLHQDIHEGGKTVRLRDGRYLNEQGWVDGPSVESFNQDEPPF